MRPKKMSDADWAAVFHELQLRAYKMSGGSSRTGTMRGTALVNEALDKVLALDKGFDSTRQFVSYCRAAMGTLLIDYHRSRTRHAPYADELPAQLEGMLVLDNADSMVDVMLLASRLEKDRFVRDAALVADVAAMRFALGLELQAIAQALDLSVGTVKEHLQFFAAWAGEEIRGELRA